MKKVFAVWMILCLLLGSVAFAERAIESNAAQAPELDVEFLWYVHDPRENPSAMADIVEDPTAVYGFRPSPDGNLASYVTYLDWSKPEEVAEGRQDRLAYHESIEDMYVMFNEMKAEGKTTEEIARAVSAKRNEIRMSTYDDDPDGLAAMKARNLEKYGHEEGPQADELYAQYGSWQKVLEGAFSANSGMDACLGLYDDYYELYIAAGQVSADMEPSAEDKSLHESLIQANSWNAIRSSHASEQTYDACYQGPEPLFEFSARVDDDSRYYTDEEGATLARREFYIDTGKDGTLYQELKPMEDYVKALEAFQSGMDAIALDGDVLLSLQERDGAYYAITETQDRAVLEKRIQRATDVWTLDEPLTWQEGMTSRNYIIYDEDTLEQRVAWISLRFPDGSVKILQREAYAYDTPDESESGPLASWFEAEAFRTVTLVFDADTGHAESVEYSVPAGVRFFITINGVHPAVYTDETMTTEMDYDATADMGDCALYIRADGT